MGCFGLLVVFRVSTQRSRILRLRGREKYVWGLRGLVVNPEPRNWGCDFAGGVGEIGGEGFGPDYIMLRNGTGVAVSAPKVSTDHQGSG